MERALSFLIWISRTLGAPVVIGVVIVMLHLPKPVVLTASTAPVVDEGPMPDLGGAVGSLNWEPLNRKSLRGKVVPDRGAQQSIIRKGVITLVDSVALTLLRLEIGANWPEFWTQVGPNSYRALVPR